MTVHEVLVKARNEIADRGWTHGHDPVTSVFGPGPTCVGLALQRGGTPNLSSEDCALACRLIGGELGVVAWNDAPGRTEAEVLARLDQAIVATAPAPDLSFLTEPDRVEA